MSKAARYLYAPCLYGAVSLPCSTSAYLSTDIHSELNCLPVPPSLLQVMLPCAHRICCKCSMMLQDRLPASLPQVRPVAHACRLGPIGVVMLAQGPAVAFSCTQHGVCSGQLRSAKRSSHLTAFPTTRDLCAAQPAHFVPHLPRTA